MSIGGSSGFGFSLIQRRDPKLWGASKIALDKNSVNSWPRGMLLKEFLIE